MNNNLDLQSDLINNEIRIVMGFEVDYSPEATDKDFNNGGTWGKIINKGIPILSIAFNPNVGEKNFGKSDYEIKERWMKKQKEALRQMPIYMLEYLASIKFHVIPNETMYK